MFIFIFAIRHNIPRRVVNPNEEDSTAKEGLRVSVGKQAFYAEERRCHTWSFILAELHPNPSDLGS